VEDSNCEILNSRLHSYIDFSFFYCFVKLVIVKYMDASNLGTFRDSTLFPNDLTTVTVAFFPQTSVFSRSKLILWSEFPR